jgi:DNA polymerase-3 subunit gamma/tau
MEKNFVVSARKYRPSNFDLVVGQQHITTTLLNAIESKQLAQAFLFCGPRGVGKTTCARILAKMINGNSEDDTSYNIFELDAASNNSVDDIRNLVEQVRFPPAVGKYKVYIIDEVHMLSNAAFNAFLKTLEEPPSYAIFILATTEKHKVIPTILSRCQIFDFNRIRIEDIVYQLKKIAIAEEIEAEGEALHLIAQKADGAMRDALSLFDMIVTFSKERKITYKTTIENLHILDYDYFFSLTQDFLEGQTSKILLTFDEILAKGFDPMHFLSGLAAHFRNLLVSKDEPTLKLLKVADSIREKYRKQAALTKPAFLLSALNLVSNCELNLKNVKDPNVFIELTLLKIAHLDKAITLASLEKKK